AGGRLVGPAAGTLTAGRSGGRSAGRPSPGTAVVSGGRRGLRRAGAAATGIPAVAALGTASARTVAKMRARARELPRVGEAAQTLKALPREVRSSYRYERDRNAPQRSRPASLPSRFTATSNGSRRPVTRSSTSR